MFFFTNNFNAICQNSLSCTFYFHSNTQSVDGPLSPSSIPFSSQYYQPDLFFLQMRFVSFPSGPHLFHPAFYVGFFPAFFSACHSAFSIQPMRTMQGTRIHFKVGDPPGRAGGGVYLQPPPLSQGCPPCPPLFRPKAGKRFKMLRFFYSFVVRRDPDTNLCVSTTTPNGIPIPTDFFQPPPPLLKGA